MKIDLTQLPDDQLPEPHELPGELQLVARLLGVRAALVLEHHLASTCLYIASCDPIRIRIRDRAIRAEYDSGQITVRELARKYPLGERQIKRVLAQADEDHDRAEAAGQLRLW